MYNISVLAFLKDVNTERALRLFCERFDSAEHALWEKGMRLLHQYHAARHAGVTLTVSSALQHMDDRHDIYIVDLREYSEEELDRLYIAKTCELLLLTDGATETAARFAALQRRTPRLLCARLPLVSYELECLMQAILGRIEPTGGDREA
ncbi:hypothetical protein NST83_18730 [Paenibacillus sp. FSL R10-2782]|uniref:hypothetical protein n=1 Tax=Paenibacillus sp. FSL R10-2782 TaxID=2954661 RepID=UPI0031598ABB